MAKALTQIVEGTTKLTVPKTNNIKGPATSKVPVFYNPVMEFNRDVSALVLNNYLKSKKHDYQLKVLDGLAGTGIRGVRFANEIPGLSEIVINDRNPTAFKLIKKNIKANKLKNADPQNEDLNVLLVNNRNRFDHIDIDPFGSPVEFIEQSVRAIRDKGMLSVTATDTATLCGRYPKTCARRYDATVIKTPFNHEVGVRVLMGYCIRQAAKYDLALSPILCHSTDHYYRIYFSARKGGRRANEVIKQIGFIWYNDVTSDRGFSPEPVTELQYAGPLWTGELFDNKLVNALKPEDFSFGTDRKINKMTDLWRLESTAPGLYYEIPELSSKLKISPPPREKFFKAMENEGYLVTRTHFDPQGFRTDADIENLKNVLTGL
jgi:tRNA (guanine26-N2/guanine27-N2)-dimethyltransferase